jgi:hypothetical protein
MQNGSPSSSPQEIPFSIPPYLLSIEDVAQHLSSDLDNGLNESEIKERQAVYGPNAVISLLYPLLLRNLPPFVFSNPLVWWLTSSWKEEKG